MNKGLGRVHIVDDRDRGFPMASLLPAQLPGETYRYWWPTGWWGDQLATPRCVAFAWLHWLHDGPVTHKRKAPYISPARLYTEAQKRDPWPGENYDGTSVRAGAKVLQEYGLIQSYLWAWDVDTMVKALLTQGPVVVGTNWYTSMFNPDAEGFLRISGRIAGGHAYLVNGVNVKKERFRIKNSWGRRWGIRGGAWIGFEEMSRLLREYGEACLAVEIKTE